MADSPRYFDSPEHFILIVGQESKKLYVARPLLEKIPFFNNALKGDQFKEAKDKVFEMPEDNPQAVSDLLHFVLADHVKPITENSWVENTKEEGEILKSVVASYVKVFIAADKFMAEKTANEVLDCLQDYFACNDVDPDLIDILGSAGLQATTLYEFMVDSLAGKIKTAIKEGRKYFAIDNKDFLTTMTSDTATALLRSLMSTKHHHNSSHFIGDCSLHTHQLTECCPQLPNNGW